MLARHGAEYVNVTEEVWQGRVAPAESVREAVEQAYGPRGNAFGLIPDPLRSRWHGEDGLLLGRSHAA